MTTPVPNWTKNLLDRANEEITVENWPEIALRRDRGPEKDLPEDGYAGVRSYEECKAIQSRFRRHLEAWTLLRSPTSQAARQLRGEAVERAQLQLGTPTLRNDCRLEPTWSTADDSYEQQNYALLLVSFMFDHVAPRQLHRCIGCGNFFMEREKRQKKFCSPACRNRTYVRRYRTGEAGPQESPHDRVRPEELAK